MKNIFFLTACSLVFFTCKPLQNIEKMKTSQHNSPSKIFDTQGHRGCRGLMPENTIPAMLHALKLGVTTLEMDAVITKDKQVILSHEPFFNHEISTKPDGTLVSPAEEIKLNIFQMDYAAVARFDVGLRPHPRFPRQQKIAALKPLLSDVFDSVRNFIKTTNRRLPFFNIETKCLPIGDNIYHPAPAEFVTLLMEVIVDKKMENYVTIQSFDFRTLQYMHKHYPHIATAMLIEEKDNSGIEDQLKRLGFVPAIYSPHFELVTPELVRSCHEKEMRVIPWTINDRREIQRLKLIGVDGIISDYPDLF